MTRPYTATEWAQLPASERALEIERAITLLTLSGLSVPQHNAAMVLKHAIEDLRQYAPREETVTELAVRSTLLQIGYIAESVEWLAEDDCFEVTVRDHLMLDRELLRQHFIVDDMDWDTAWIKPREDGRDV